MPPDAEHDAQQVAQSAEQAVGAVAALSSSSDASSSVVDVARGAHALGTGTVAGVDAIERIVGASDVSRAVRTGAQIVAGVASAVTEAVSAMHWIDALMSHDQRLGLATFAWEGHDAAGWRVHAVHISEGLSELYCAVVDLASDDATADADRWLGASCTLTVSRGPLRKPMHGIVREVEHLGATPRDRLCRVHLVPALWTLSQQRNCRVFQGLNVPKLVAQVVSQGLAPYQRALRIELQREYPVREFCVQYDESSLDFVMRLLEEEGIAFYFDHGDAVEELVLVDTPGAMPPVSTEDDAPLSILGPEQDTAAMESVRTFTLVRSLQPTRAVVRDRDWTRPRLDLTRTAHRTDERGHVREVFEHGTGTLSAYERAQYTAADTRVRALTRREEYAARAVRTTGRSNVTGFAAGRTVHIEGGDHDGMYLLTRVMHTGCAPDEQHHDVTTQPPAGEARYYNVFECQPASVVFRPPRVHVRPRIDGVQTATVVGALGDDDIATDEHGRIRVQFHWDREGASDERSSCWIRVAQAWAGAGFGAVFIPRVGMEVVVAFEQGDPDRPLVIGCLYNGDHPTPHALAGEQAHKTRSGWRTRSTPVGPDVLDVGFNELMFDDAAGAERIDVHAQRDLDTRVRRHRTAAVYGDDTLTVHGARMHVVRGEEHVTVHRARFTTVENSDIHVVAASQSIHVGSSEVDPALRAVDVIGDIQEHASQTLTLTADRALRLVCGDSEIVMGPDTIEIRAPRVTVTGREGVFIGSPEGVRLEGASAALALDVNARVTAQRVHIASAGGAVVELEGPLLKLNS